MKEIHFIPSADQVHFVASKTRKVGVGTVLVGGVFGVLPILIGGTIGWGLSVSADELAKIRIRNNSKSGQSENPLQSETVPDDSVQ